MSDQIHDPMSLEGDFITPAPTTEPEKMPDLPDTAFFGGFEKLYEAYWGTNETCKPYLLAQGLATVSTVVGRTAALSIGRLEKTERARPYRVYPNTYQAIIGDTSYARKSTCRSNTIADIRDADSMEEVVFEKGVASAESLVKGLRNDGKEESPTWEDGDFPEGVRCLLHLDELRTVLANSRRTGTQTIIPKLTELYECPAIEENNAAKVKAYYPVLNVFACSTQEWLETSVYTEDVAGGFINRFMFWNYEEVEGVPFPESPYADPLEEWINLIKHARVANHFREFVLCEDAADEYEQMYHAHRKEQTEEEDMLMAKVNSRRMGHAFKLALLYSLVTNESDDDEISVNAWGAACEVADYLTKSTYHIFKDVGMDKVSRDENAVLEALNELGNRATSREIQRKIGNRKTNAKVINSTLEELLKGGHLAIETEGRTTVYVRI